MKLRKRYLIFSVKGSSSYSLEEVKRAIIREMKRMFGEKYLALSGIELIEYNEEKGIGIIRCYHRYVEYIRATLALISKIKGDPIAFYTLKVSGTRKKALSIVRSCISRQNRN